MYTADKQTENEPKIAFYFFRFRRPYIQMSSFNNGLALVIGDFQSVYGLRRLTGEVWRSEPAYLQSVTKTVRLAPPLL